MMNVKQEDDNDPRCKTGRFMTLLCLGEVCLCLRVTIVKARSEKMRFIHNLASMI